MFLNHVFLPPSYPTHAQASIITTLCLGPCTNLHHHHTHARTSLRSSPHYAWASSGSSSTCALMCAGPPPIFIHTYLPHAQPPTVAQGCRPLTPAEQAPAPASTTPTHPHPHSCRCTQCKACACTHPRTHRCTQCKACARTYPTHTTQLQLNSCTALAPTHSLMHLRPHTPPHTHFPAPAFQPFALLLNASLVTGKSLYTRCV